MMRGMTQRKNTDFIDELNAEFNAESSEDAANESKAKSEDFSQMLEDSLKKPTRKVSVGDKIRGPDSRSRPGRRLRLRGRAKRWRDRSRAT